MDGCGHLLPLSMVVVETLRFLDHSCSSLLHLSSSPLASSPSPFPLRSLQHLLAAFSKGLPPCSYLAKRLAKTGFVAFLWLFCGFVARRLRKRTPLGLGLGLGLGLALGVFGFPSRFFLWPFLRCHNCPRSAL